MSVRLSPASWSKVLAVVIALQLGVAGIGAATIAERTETDQRATDRPNTSEGTEDVVAALPEGGPAAGPNGTQPGAAAAAVGQPAPTAAIPAPRPGTYRYTQTVKTTSEDSSTTTNDEKTEEIARRIERLSESAGEIIDRRHTPSRVIATGDNGSKSESTSYEERSWRPDGAWLRTEVSHYTDTQTDGTKRERRSECNWEPDRLQLVLPLRVGLEWAWESKCTSNHTQGEVTTTNKGRARVVGTRDLDIGGQSVPTFILELTATEDSSGNLGQQGGARFESHSDQITTSFFAPSLGLPVRIETDNKTQASIAGPPGSGEPHRSTTTRTSTSQLVSTDPT